MNIIQFLLSLVALVFCLMLLDYPFNINIFMHLHRSMLTQTDIQKKYNDSQNSVKMLKTGCNQQIEESNDLIELRKACENQLKELDVPGNRVDVVLPFFLSVASFVISIIALQNDSFETDICMFICVSVLTIIVMLLYAIKTLERKKKYLTLLIEAIDEKEHQENVPAQREP